MVGEDLSQVAYLLAVGLMLEGHYRWMALMLGLATSFHRRLGISGSGRMASPETQNSFVDIVVDSSNLLSSECVYCLAGGAAIHSHPTGSVQPSYVCLSATASPPEPLVLVLKLVDRVCTCWY